MSSEIEYRYQHFTFDGQRAFQNFHALSIEQGAEMFYPDYGPTRCVVAFVEEGSSNTFDATTGRPSRHWALQHVGSQGTAMQRIIRASEYVESGMTKPFGRDQKAENYISAYRKRISEDRPLEQLFQQLQGSTLALVIQSFRTDRAERQPWWQKAVKAGWVYTPPYRTDPTAVRFIVSDIETLECGLLALEEIGNGVCGTMASFGMSTSISSALDRLSGGEQLSLLCG